MKIARYTAAVTLVLCASLALAESSSQQSFATMKSLAGSWEGKNDQGKTIKVTFRETSGGSALLSELEGVHDAYMVSMIHMDGDRLLMTHYCSAGNQPRMQATLTPDGKSVAFDFVDATNLAGPEVGHMQHVVFALRDADHHVEEWTFVDHGKEIKQTFTMQRTK